jgi:hypothetical protein
LYLVRIGLWILIFLEDDVELKSKPFSILPIMYSLLSKSVKMRSPRNRASPSVRVEQVNFEEAKPLCGGTIDNGTD